VIALLRRDLALAVRAGGGFGLGLAFFLIVIVLVPFGVGPEAALLSSIAPGILWVALPLTLAAPALGFLLNLSPNAYVWLLASLAIGTPALSIIGVFGAALTVGLRRGGLLMSLLVLPLYVPTLIFGAEAVRRGADGLGASTPLLMLAGITLGCFALLPFAASAALRVNLR